MGSAVDDGFVGKGSITALVRSGGLSVVVEDGSRDPLWGVLTVVLLTKVEGGRGAAFGGVIVISGTGSFEVLSSGLPSVMATLCLANKALSSGGIDPISPVVFSNGTLS